MHVNLSVVMFKVFILAGILLQSACTSRTCKPKNRHPNARRPMIDPMLKAILQPGEIQ